MSKNLLVGGGQLIIVTDTQSSYTPLDKVFKMELPNLHITLMYYMYFDLLQIMIVCNKLSVVILFQPIIIFGQAKILKHK